MVRGREKERENKSEKYANQKYFNPSLTGIKSPITVTSSMSLGNFSDAHIIFSCSKWWCFRCYFLPDAALSSRIEAGSQQLSNYKARDHDVTRRPTSPSFPDFFERHDSLSLFLSFGDIPPFPSAFHHHFGRVSMASSGWSGAASRTWWASVRARGLRSDAGLRVHIWHHGRWRDELFLMTSASNTTGYSCNTYIW